MSNLQELHDYYLETKPSVGKVQAASKLLVRLCKHMDVETPEDITPEVYQQLPQVIDRYFKNDHHKAIQDKSTLAEMIGRYGPRDGWERAFETLLKDEDKNLKQFTLSALIFAARQDLSGVLTYLDNYATTDDALMLNVVARLVTQVVNKDNKSILLKRIKQWSENGNGEIVGYILEEIDRNQMRSAGHGHDENYQSFIDALQSLKKSA